MRREKLIIIACVACYLLLAVLLANVRAPQSDEGHFAEGAVNLAFHGRLVLPTWTPWISTLDQRVYAMMPVYFFGLATWFRVFGVGMLTMRYFSVLWGCILVVSYFLLLRQSSKDRILGIIALFVLAFSYDVVNLTTARYDGMAAGLVALGLGLYAVLRRYHMAVAILVANSCIAAAAMCHPYGAFGFVYFGIFFLMLDRDRFRFSQLALIALPYVVALAAWGTYIAKDPAMFRAQFGGNASAHTVSVFRPVAAVVSELRERYWPAFGGGGPGASAYARVHLAILLLYILAYAASWLTPAIRTERVNRAVLFCAAFGFFALTFAEGTRGYVYLAHVIGFYSLVVAIWLRHLIVTGGWQRLTAFAIMWCLALFSVATIAYRAHQNSYQRAFVPAAAYLKAHLQDRQLVFAGGDFGIPLGFADHVLDDRQLGYRNHIRPDYIVIDRDYASSFHEEKAHKPDVYANVMQTLQEYQLVFERQAGADYYRIYARPDLNPGQSHVGSSATTTP